MLKVLLKSLDDVDDAIKGFYKEQVIDGETVYVLQLQGFNDHPDVTSLKNAHEAQKTISRDRKAEIDTLKKRLEGLPEDFDSDDYDALKAQAEAGGTGNGKPDPKEIDRIVEDRVTKATKKLAEENDSLKASNDKLVDQRNKRERNAVLTEALQKAGVTDPAYLKAAAAMHRDSMEVLEDEETGELSVLIKDPELGTMKPVPEFIGKWAEGDEGKAFVKAADNEGGGGGGGGPSGDQSADNPWKAETFNMTKQHQIETSDPAKAARLKAAAGVK